VGVIAALDRPPILLSNFPLCIVAASVFCCAAGSIAVPAEAAGLRARDYPGPHASIFADYRFVAPVWNPELD
jgi:hypothetical protein